MFVVFTPMTPAVRGVEDRHRPRHEAAPVVAALDAESVEQRDEVAGQMLEVVGLDPLGRIAATVATLVGRDHVEAGTGESGDLVTPGVGELREAMAEHDRGPAPALVHQERECRLAFARGHHALGQPDGARGRHCVGTCRGGLIAGGAYHGRRAPRFHVPPFHSRLRPWTPAALPK